MIYTRDSPECQAGDSSGPGAPTEVERLNRQYRQRLVAPTATSTRDRAAWLQRRTTIREGLRARLGLSHVPSHLPLSPHLTAEGRVNGCPMHRVELMGWPEVTVSGWMATPPSVQEDCPAVLWIMDTPWLPLAGEATSVKLAELASDGCLVLALDGFVVDRPELGLTTAGGLCWTHFRALDFLSSRPEVAGGHIGLLGTGAGAILATSIIALDDRIAAAAVTGDCAYFRDVLNEDPAWLEMLVPPGVLQLGDRPELIGCLAPRPLLISSAVPSDQPVAGTAAGDLAGVYGLFHLQERLHIERVANAPPGPSTWQRSAQWLWRTLGASGRGSSSEIPESSTCPRERASGAPLAAPGDGPAPAIARYYLERVAAQPPRLESRAARKNYQTRLAAELRALLGDPGSEVPLEAAHPEGELSGGPQRVLFRSEADAWVAADLAMPERQPAAAAVILTSGDPSAAAPGEEQAWIRACRRAGIAAFVLHSRLTLEDSPAWRPVIHVAGRSPAAMAARDVIAGVDYLFQRFDVEHRQIAVVGQGRGGVAALLAAAWDPRLRAVAADCCGTTYRDGGRGLPRLPGVLTLADLPQLASLIAPRPLWLCRVPAARAGFSSRRYFDWTKRTYQSLGAVDGLQLDTAEAPEPSELCSWLQAQLRKR
jgi:dienelactone hydrolase